MARIKGGMTARRRKKKYFRLAKGYRGAKSKLYKQMKEQVERSLQYAYKDRRNKKRLIRALWIERINAGVRSQGMNYSRFIFGLKNAKIVLDRKVMADMAINDTAAFNKLVEIAKSNQKASSPTAA